MQICAIKVTCLETGDNPVFGLVWHSFFKQSTVSLRGLDSKKFPNGCDYKPAHDTETKIVFN